MTGISSANREGDLEPKSSTERNKLLGLTGKYFEIRRGSTVINALCLLAEGDEHGDIWLQSRLFTAYGSFPEGSEFYFLPLGVPSVVREVPIEEATLWILAK